MNQKVSLKEKVGYGFGDMASSMFWKIFGMYLLFFYTDVFGITAAAAGTMFLVARLWDSFFDLAVGIVSDRTRTRWGQYRPYLLWFAIPFAVMGVITFYVPDFAESGKLIYAYITYSLMLIVYSIVNVPYASLLGVMSPDPKVRNVLSSYRMSFAFIGSFITFMLLQPLVDFFASRFDTEKFEQARQAAQSTAETSVSTSPVGWVLAVAVIGTVCAILFFLCFFLTRERVKPVDREMNEKASVKQDLMYLLKNSPWWILVGAGLAALLFNAVRDGVAIFYFRDYVGSNYHLPVFGWFSWDMATIYFLVGQAANLIGVVVAPALSARYGKRNTYIIAMILACVLSVAFYYIPNNVAWILTMQVLISLCAGYVLPLLWSMFSDIVDYQELKTGRRASGLIFSSSSMSQKLGWAFGAALGGWILAAFNYSKDLADKHLPQAAETVFGEQLMLSIFPAICALLAAVAMFFYPLTEKKVREVTEALQAKRAA